MIPLLDIATHFNNKEQFSKIANNIQTSCCINKSGLQNAEKTLLLEHM